MKVVYKSDSAYYTYFEDPDAVRAKCKRPYTLDIQSVTLMDAPSVKAFFAAGEGICQREDKVVVCTLEADLEVDAVIVKSEDGHPLAYIKNVISYKYRN
jgi:hypothetical protein